MGPSLLNIYYLSHTHMYIHNLFPSLPPSRSDLASGYSKEGLLKPQDPLTSPPEAPPNHPSGAAASSSSFSSAVSQNPSNLGALPLNWEIAYTANYEKYFIDHNTGSTHWFDPRLSQRMKQGLLECSENGELCGWVGGCLCG